MPIANRNKNMLNHAAYLASQHPDKQVQVKEIVRTTGIDHASTVLSKHGWYFGLMPISRGVYGLRLYHCLDCKGFCPRGTVKGRCLDCQ